MPQSLDQYLSSLLAKYHYPDQAKKDITNALQHYRNLSPTTSQFVFNDGIKKELFCLDGTIPVNYKGTTYNIPVCIWLLDTHPYNSPMCYVKPTSYMQIKVSRHVDQTGRIFLPYLHEWSPSSSDLLGLIQVMIITFGETPPVFSKPQEDGSPAYPGARNTGASGGFFRPATGVMPPAMGGQPPYPATAMPPYPPGGATGMPTPWTPYPPASGAPSSGTVGSGMPPYPVFPSVPSGAYPPYPTSGPATASTGGYPYPPASTTSTSVSAAVAVSQTGTITQEHIRASLLTAVEEKVKARLKEALSGAQAEMDVLKRTHDELTQGKAKLDDMINRMDREQAELEANLQNLRERNDELKELIHKVENQGSINVDEAVVTTAPLYKQLLNAFAEENATEDAIYYLGEALRKGVIDLDVFLKHVRELSRKQFLLRALMQKCREKAQLP